MKAGGRCAPVSRGGGLKDNELNKDFNNLLAQRAALDAQMATPVPTKEQLPSYATPALTQMVTRFPEAAVTPIKKADLIRKQLIDQILNGKD